MRLRARHLAHLVIATSAFATSAAAQSILVPSALADGTTEGASSTSYPWNRTAAPIRVQYIYDSTTFNNAGIDSDMSIHTLRWRADGGRTAAGGQFSTATIRMCHSNNAGSAIDATFANNYGPDLSTVYEGAVTVQPAAGGTPNDFYVEVQLQRDFFYSPSSGDHLLVEIELDGAATWSGAGSSVMDAITNDPEAGRVFSTSAGSTTGTTQPGVGAALEIDYRPAVVIPDIVGGSPQSANSSTSYPWNRANGMRVQYAYDSDHFTSQFPSSVQGSGILIDRLRWRADPNTVVSPGGVYPDVSVRLSTMRGDYNTVSSVFADNHGPDQVTVFDGGVTIDPVGTGSAVADFFVTIEFDSPFFYRPDDGDLLIDLLVDPASSGTSFPTSDATFGAGSDTYRIYNTSSSQALVGTVQADVAPVVEARFARVKAPLVVPNSREIVEGGSSTRYPWGRTNSGIRVLYAYDTTHFTDEGINHPILINRLRWRANGGELGTSGTFPDAAIRLSSGVTDYTALNATFDSNHGADLSTVFQGTVQVSAATGSAPNDYSVDVLLNRPFLYNPSAGADLMIDLSVDCSRWTGSAAPPTLDAEFGTPEAIGARVYDLANRNGTSGTVQNNISAVIEVDYSNPKGLCTLFKGGNGLNAGSTVYMDAAVTAADGININRLAINTFSVTNCDVEVYVTPGTYAGNTTNPAAWSLFATGSGQGANSGRPTIIDLQDTLLPAGNWGIAIHYVNCTMRYTNGTGLNQTYGDSNLVLNLGESQGGLFTGTTFSPRVWNGCIYYDTEGYYAFDGPGCMTSAGQVVTNTAVDGYAPGLGRTFVAEFNNLPDPIAFMTLGFNNTTWAGQPLPIDLGASIGLTGCTYYSEPLDTYFLLADGSGRATWSSTTPNIPSLAGARFYTQALVIDSNINNSLNAVVSDAAVGVVAF